LYAGYRFFLEEESEIHPATGTVPLGGYNHLLERRFEDAIETFKHALETPMTPRTFARAMVPDDGNVGPNGNLCSALAEVYHTLAFDKLSQQVRKNG
jgi:hypothetical protein